MNEILASLLLLVSLLINLSSLDDIFIDLLSFGIAHFPFRRAAAKPATLPNIAIFVANWREEDVIGKMVEGQPRPDRYPAGFALPRRLSE
jgi:bacteriophage N4 adsorption protein B